MAGFKMSEWISRPPQEVFDFITTPDNAPKVVQSVKSMVQQLVVWTDMTYERDNDRAHVFQTNLIRGGTIRKQPRIAFYAEL